MSNRPHRVLPRRLPTTADRAAKKLLRLVAAGSVAATVTVSLGGPTTLIATLGTQHQAMLASAVSATSQSSPAYGAPGLLGARLNAPIVSMSSTPSGQGAWLLGSDGGIFTLGDARFFGSTGGMRLNAPVVGMTSTIDGGGYWAVAADGGIFAYGDASFDGSLGGMHLNAPVVGMARMTTGSGYWLVARDGGVFAFGSAPFEGSAGSLRLRSPIVGMASTPDGHGYWLVASDGGVFSYGDAAFYGSPAEGNVGSPIVGMAVLANREGRPGPGLRRCARPVSFGRRGQRFGCSHRQRLGRLLRRCVDRRCRGQLRPEPIGRCRDLRHIFAGLRFDAFDFDAFDFDAFDFDAFDFDAFDFGSCFGHAVHTGEQQWW
jgi:hypothetical protein